MLEGALILLAGILLGIGVRSLPARRRAPKPVEAVCGCTHHHSMHDPETGACNASVAVSKYDKYGTWVGKEYKSCACLQYSGPLPLPAYYAPEIAGETGQ